MAGGASDRQFWPLSPTTDSLSLPDYSLHFLGRDDTTTSYVTARPQLWTHSTTYTATTLTACTLLLETTADYITGLGRLAKQQNLLSFLLESSTTSAAAKKDKMKLSRK